MMKPASEWKAIRILFVLDVLMTVVVVVFFRHMLASANLDIKNYYQPWYEHILAHGRWTSLEGSYANYSPPYLYMLSAFSFFARHISPLHAVKLVQVPGMVATGVLGWSIARAVGVSNKRAVLTGWLLALSPELVLNALMWGQCDTIYTAFLLLTIRLMMAKRWNWAMAMFGIAVAFKLQALFAAPMLAALLFMGDLPAASVLLSPVAYALMLLPAWLAGRPAMQLLLIYRQQYNFNPAVAMNVANPYSILTRFTLPDLPLAILVTRIGLILGLLVTAAMVWVLSRCDTVRRGAGMIAGMALPLLVEPYILPKMHDRYFFPGNLLLLLLATLDRRLIVPAVLMQAAAIYVYFRFFENLGFPSHCYIIPAIVVTIALVIFWKNFRTSCMYPATKPDAL